MVKGKIKKTGGPDVALFQMTLANRQALEVAGMYWWRRMMPRHFTVEGGKYYGYQKRKGDDEPPRKLNPETGRLRTNRAYSWKKRRRFRHNKPLVWTGASEAMAKRSVTIKFANRINKTPAGMTKTGRQKYLREKVMRCLVVMQLPKYFYQYQQGRPDKAAELLRAMPEEMAILGRIHSAKLAHFYRNAPRITRTERVN